MKRSLRNLCIPATSLALVLACAGVSAQGRDTPAKQPMPTAAAMADKPAGSSTASAGDSLALGLLGAINEHEIAAAKQAIGKSVSGDVLEYAQLMQKQHSENLAKTKTLGPLSDGPEIQAQKSKGAKELSTLGATPALAYAKAYIDAMVKGHAEALDTIDRKLLPAATSPTVKQHLNETRGHVAMHLETAKAIAAGM